MQNIPVENEKRHDGHYYPKHPIRKKCMKGSNSGPHAREAATKSTELRRLTDTSDLYNTGCLYFRFIQTKILKC